MARQSYQAGSSLDSTEQVIVDLVRLGLAGDTSSLRQLARKLLRRRPGATSSTAFREQLGSLLVGHADSGLRAARPPIPVETEGQFPLVSIDDSPEGEQPVLAPDVQRAVAQLIDQRRKADRLAQSGLEPPKTLLLHGPPGVGKTITARYLASELDLPLMTVELAALMSSLLGQTGQNLRSLLDHSRSFPCVLLLDEFDAVAKRRDDQSDIGELKRLVNVLLLELERWPQTGLLVAATNHPQLLDPAIGRRFDVELHLDVPNQADRVAIIDRALTRFGIDVSSDVIAACALAMRGATGADLERDVAAAARTVILDDNSDASTVLSEIATRELRRGATSDIAQRRAFCALATKQLGLTQRAVAEMLGISHPTVGKLAREWRELEGNEITAAAVA
jgi:SpoVK/Ycf46/Vps4 family AAA+-type ATPase